MEDIDKKLSVAHQKGAKNLSTIIKQSDAVMMLTYTSNMAKNLMMDLLDLA